MTYIDEFIQYQKCDAIRYIHRCSGTSTLPKEIHILNLKESNSIQKLILLIETPTWGWVDSRLCDETVSCSL